MRKIIFFFITASLIVNACQSNYTNKKLTDTSGRVEAHSSQNAVDWNGEYTALLPCADCPGIKSSLQLNNDNTFKSEWEYLERNVKLKDSGNFIWLDGDNIKLQGNVSKEKYRVGENKLTQLDNEGNAITGPLEQHYIFIKKR